MGRGRSAEDYQRTAEENGWDSEAYKEEDSVQLTKDEHGEVYKQNEQQALDQWTMWVPDSVDRACLGTPASGRSSQNTDTINGGSCRGGVCLPRSACKRTGGAGYSSHPPVANRRTPHFANRRTPHLC